MNRYIKFILHVLLTCFFIALLGIFVLSVLDLQRYMMGWGWGMLIMILYLLTLGVHANSFTGGNPYGAVRKARRQMMWRLVLVGALVAIGIQIPGVEPLSLFAAVVIIQPVLYMLYWWNSHI